MKYFTLLKVLLGLIIFILPPRPDLFVPYIPYHKEYETNYDTKE